MFSGGVEKNQGMEWVKQLFQQIVSRRRQEITKQFCLKPK